MADRDADRVTCPDCGGFGKVPDNPVWNGRGWEDRWVWCRACEGEGYVPAPVVEPPK